MSNAHLQYHITHLRSTNYEKETLPKGGITLVFKVVPFLKDSGHEGFEIQYGLSFCNETDLYNKRIGLDIAVLRCNTAGGLFVFDNNSKNKTGKYSLGSLWGAGKFVIDISKEMVDENNVLVSSGFLHKSIVKEILSDARNVFREAISHSVYKSPSYTTLDTYTDSLYNRYKIGKNEAAYI